MKKQLTAIEQAERKRLVVKLAVLYCLVCLLFFGLCSVYFGPKAIEFWATIPVTQIVANLGETDMEKVEGEEYQKWLCGYYDGSIPEWLLWGQKDKPSYCEQRRQN